MSLVDYFLLPIKESHPIPARAGVANSGKYLQKTQYVLPYLIAISRARPFIARLHISFLTKTQYLILVNFI
ncbi:hypothetical protein [Undibacterium sp. TJN19]|uniref:hypothetical protein n=1 Tax=Undibacterium sp. TJN19 TaxID=3413055 RepID=UPI003BF5BBF9